MSPRAAARRDERAQREHAFFDRIGHVKRFGVYVLLLPNAVASVQRLRFLTNRGEGLHENDVRRDCQGKTRSGGARLEEEDVDRCIGVKVAHGFVSCSVANYDPNVSDPSAFENDVAVLDDVRVLREDHHCE